MSLVTLLTEWLPQQRWFATKSAPVEALQPKRVAVLVDEPDLRCEIWVVEVEAAGETIRYQVPLAIRAEAAPPQSGALIGELAGQLVYDATGEPRFTAVLYELMRGAITVANLDCGGTVDLPELDAPGRLLGAEQSNTSVVYGDAVVLKLFRRLTASPNPDLEITQRLGELKSSHAPAAIGWIEGAGATLALAQPFLRGAAEGWTLALASVRDLLGTIGDDVPGGDFAPDATRLGAMTAGLHADLRDGFGIEDRPSAELASIAAGMGDRLDAAVRAVPALAPLKAAIATAYATVAQLSGPITLQRIHGDYHLGQVLRTEQGWIAIDFEGEPARPRAERVALLNPLRDVAGMLRSFDYAAGHLALDHDESPATAERAAAWVTRNRKAFCSGYAQAAGHDPRDSAVLLRAFELDKAVYEVRYEADHRPKWLPIPLHGIARLVA